MVIYITVYYVSRHNINKKLILKTSRLLMIHIQNHPNIINKEAGTL